MHSLMKHNIYLVPGDGQLFIQTYILIYALTLQSKPLYMEMQTTLSIEHCLLA